MLEYPWDAIDSLRPLLESADLIQWYGDGEFFAYSNISELLILMQNLPDVQHGFSTNGKKLRTFARQLAPINFQEMILSIDGASIQTFESIRRGIKFSDVVGGVQSLQVARTEIGLPPVRLRINCISMSLNIHELPSLVRLACFLGVSSIEIVPLIVYDVSPDMAAWKVDPDVELEWCLKAVEVAKQLRIAIKHTQRQEIDFTPEEMIESTIPDPPAPIFEPFCHLPWSRLVVDTDGSVSVCCHNTEKCGNVLSQPLKDIWQGEVYSRLRETILAAEVPESCTDFCNTARMMRQSKED